MKNNVLRKLLPVMLTITLTAGIAPVSYAAAEEPVQQTEDVEEEPVQDLENTDIGEVVSDEEEQSGEKEEMQGPDQDMPEVITEDEAQLDESEKAEVSSEADDMDELADTYRDVIADGEYVIGEKGSRQVLDVAFYLIQDPEKFWM